MTSDDPSTYTEADWQAAYERQAVITAHNKAEGKRWQERQKNRARKSQGGLRDVWAERLRIEGIPKGFRPVPDAQLPHKTKVNRTLSLKRAEERRAQRKPARIIKERWKAESDAAKEAHKKQLEEELKLPPGERIQLELARNGGSIYHS